MQQRSSSWPHGHSTDVGMRPRVVILDVGDSARVAVLELPDSLEIGGRFCHSGTWWRVTGRRTGSRVLIAVPAPPPDQDLRPRG